MSIIKLIILFLIYPLFVYSNSIDWKFETTKYESSDKPVLIYFYTVWCPSCNWVEENIFTQQKIVNFTEKFLCLKINADKKDSWKLKSKFNVGGYPTIVFTNNNFEETKRIVGIVSYKKFLSILKEVYYNNATLTDLLNETKKDPNNPILFFKIAVKYHEKNDFENAFSYFIEIKDKLPEEKEKIYEGIIDYYKEKNDIENILKFSKEYINFSKSPNYPFYYSDYLNFLKPNIKELKIAQNKIEKFIKLNPKSLYLSDYYFALADFSSRDDAKIYYKKTIVILEKKIKSKPLKYNKAYISDLLYAYDKLEEEKKYTNLVEKVIEIFKDEFTFYYKYAKFLYKKNNYQDASKYIDKAEELSFEDNKLWVSGLKADILNALGQKEAAIKLLSETIKNTTLPEDTKVRTHRYINELKTKLKSLDMNQAITL
jgi:tetratricopeptide (TPR) repeat protein